MDYIKTKKISISALALITFALLITVFISFLNKPEIKEINITNMTDFAFTASDTSIGKSGNDIAKIPSFDYELIGYRSGINDSSVILKKGSKEYVVYKGEMLEGAYELINVTQDEVIFKNNEKLYKIENMVGKQLWIRL